MAQPKIPSQKGNYQRLNSRLDRYVALVEEVYKELNDEAAKAVASTNYSGDTPFRWKEYPQTTAKVKGILSQFVDDMETVIQGGTSTEWKNSNTAQDLIANNVLKSYGARVNGETYETLYQTNPDALEAFQKRKDNGMSLSRKLWDQSEGYKSELEAAISCAIQKGTSAITLSKRISQYLLDFPSLQKDYKELFGTAANIHDCEYRSARLARSEINMAYRAAENERWKQMDFVVGMEIKTTQNGKHEEDVCDTLAGKYPKDFEWTGWHPNCRCYKIPIMKTEEEFWADDTGSTSSVNEVRDVPDNFKRWCQENGERIKAAEKRGTLPYFVRDNKETVDGILKPKEVDKPISMENATYIHKESGGSVRTDLGRLDHANKNKQERAKFEKEFNMCKVLADNGHIVKLLEEKPGKSSPDILIGRKKADLKSTGSVGNIVKYAKKAIRQQGAERIVFEFESVNEEVHKMLKKLVENYDIHGWYYLKGTGNLHDF